MPAYRSESEVWNLSSWTNRTVLVYLCRRVSNSGSWVILLYIFEYHLYRLNESIAHNSERKCIKPITNICWLLTSHLLLYWTTFILFFSFAVAEPVVAWLHNLWSTSDQSDYWQGVFLKMRMIPTYSVLCLFFDIILDGKIVYFFLSYIWWNWFFENFWDFLSHFRLSMSISSSMVVH